MNDSCTCNGQFKRGGCGLACFFRGVDHEQEVYVNMSVVKTAEEQRKSALLTAGKAACKEKSRFRSSRSASKTRK
jgi:hypothetical protein